MDKRIYKNAVHRFCGENNGFDDFSKQDKLEI
jgi:hypothetical protein